MSVPSDRLNGWKEIAAHLGKGVRTVQRWEKVYELPVHRIGEAGGEIVFAFRSEIDAWERQAVQKGNNTEATDTVAPARSRGIAPRPRRSLHVAAFGLLAAGFAFGVVAWRADAPTLTPSGWSVQGQVLTAFGANGQMLWTYKFDVPIRETAYGGWEREHNPPPGSEPVQLIDLDADGRREVLVVLHAEAPEDRQIMCFESDGRVRFQFKFTADVRFGDTDYGSPWAPYRVFPVRNPDRTLSVWAVFIHGRWFPSAAIELDPSGAVKQEYWSNGYVTLVTSLPRNGRDKIIIGAANNEHRGASLAVFDRDGVSGAARAAKREYACTSCPGGGPEEFLVFPGTCIVRTRDGTAEVIRVESERGARLAVLVTQGVWNVPGMAGPWRPGVWYEFGLGMSVDKVEITPELHKIHEQLHREGFVDHPLAADDAHGGLPVLRWEATQFRPQLVTRTRQ